jgi:FkbH-like protein
MPYPELSWLPEMAEWRASLAAIRGADSPDRPALDGWQELVALANTRLDLLRTTTLDRRLTRLFPAPPEGLSTRPVRLAVLGSSTVDHLLPGLRVGALRHGLHLTAITGDYGRYATDLRDPAGKVRAAKPDAVLLAFDAAHLAGGLAAGDSSAASDARLDALCERMVNLWRCAQSEMGCRVIEQAALPVVPRLLGQNEHRLPGSRAAFLARFNRRLRTLADAEGVAVLAVDDAIEQDGSAAWHDPMLWHSAKQDIHPAATPLYGDLVARLLAAWQGLSRKCLVLDLDNTIWGGEVGEEGLAGIVVGHGSALGEAYVAFQDYAKNLAQRGVILAVCSKNDLASALEPFERHADMVLKRTDIAAFVANWQDKAHNLRQIAANLNIGIESLVFVDDNPAERAIVRRELPMVAVPELPGDPALFAASLARAGYFEAMQLTDEDRARGQQYQANIRRQTLQDSTSDLAGYLKSLAMQARWSRFRAIDRSRLLQLISKTNQFNLTTRRYTPAELDAAWADPQIVTLQLRLIDQFGDNGIIALLIGRLATMQEEAVLEVETWLMSCRVLGRGVELAMLNLLASEARHRGVAAIVGRYRPTAKNRMVADHYARLGFTAAGTDGEDTLWRLDLLAFVPLSHDIEMIEAAP